MVPETLQVESEELVHKRYINVWDRRIQHPSGTVYHWDIIGLDVPPPAFVVVVPYFTRSNSFTFIREWCQGPNKPLYTFAAGQFDRKSTDDVQECARLELSQETGLCGGSFVPLLPTDSDGITELKYGTNLFVPFLCINPQPDPNPHPRDAEELIEIHQNQPLSRVKQLILQGQFLLPSVQALVMALDYLSHSGHDVSPLI